MATVRGIRALYAVVALLLLMALHIPPPGRLAQAAFPSLLQTCQPSGSIPGRSGNCNTENGSECCKNGQRYTTYRCSPPVTGSTRALLTLNSFAEGGDGGGAAACTGEFYDDSKKVVALSTGWYNGGSRCRKHIVIRASNGNTVRALVVDECDSPWAATRTTTLSRRAGTTSSTGHRRCGTLWGSIRTTARPRSPGLTSARASTPISTSRRVANIYK